ncbi:hypothetical protein NVP2096O_38 [Vibrio phage 2.096.O._10N.286.48.B5]|nr:hypothetical protein NVP2096O_38 [Vibrio phage 2.096.O._10N.286.48.B5]
MNVVVGYVDVPQMEPMPFTDRYMTVRDISVKYSIDGDQYHLVIPSGFVTDGASIPMVCWQIIGTPYSPRFIQAAIVHDYMCDNDWEVDLMSIIFRELLKLNNVSNDKAELMYRAVHAYMS